MITWKNPVLYSLRVGAGQASKAAHVGGKGNSDSKHAAYLRKGKALGFNPEKKVGGGPR